MSIYKSDANENKPSNNNNNNTLTEIVSTNLPIALLHQNMMQRIANIAAFWLEFNVQQTCNRKVVVALVTITAAAAATAVVEPKNLQRK